jgi:hypothetical protein
VEETIDLRWFAPTKLSRERGKEWQFFCFKLELQAVKCAGQQQNGAIRTRLQRRTQEVVYANCCFGFSKLNETGSIKKCSSMCNALISINDKFGHWPI